MRVSDVESFTSLRKSIEGPPVTSRKIIFYDQDDPVETRLDNFTSSRMMLRQIILYDIFEDDVLKRVEKYDKHIGGASVDEIKIKLRAFSKGGVLCDFEHAP